MSTADSHRSPKTGDSYAPNSDVDVIWRPQEGPQTAFVHCPVPEILFGGSRGGGKTDGVLGRFALKAAKYGRGVKGIMFRRELPQLDAAIVRSHEIFAPIGGAYKDSTKTWHFPNGAFMRFRHLDRDSDAEKYQGSDWTDLMVEEIQNFPSLKPIMKLKATLRSARGIPCQMVATANPGGPGHLAVKKRYIDPAPMGWKVIKETSKILDPKSKKLIEVASERIYIPSRVFDNKLLLKNDPGYIARLAETGSEEQVKAWLYGLWDVVDGAFFTEWDSTRHIVKQAALPAHWLRFRAGDWGSARPFCFLWIAIASEGHSLPCGTHIPRGAAVVYHEWYGVRLDNNGEFLPNQGLKMFAEEVGRCIRDLEAQQPPVQYGVLDPSAFREDGGPSIAERIYRGSDARAFFRRADNTRVPGRGAMGGWDQVRARLRGEDLGGPRRVPMLYVMDSCVHLIRTLPMMQHDADNVEDLDSEGEDHACFHGNTLVATEQGARRIAEMAKTTGRVYTLGGELAEYVNCDMTRRGAPLLELEFSDGSRVRCTPDHKFRLPNGSFVSASRLLWQPVDEKSGPLRVVAVRHAGRADVYCLSVPSHGCFALANGTIVKNCDALRYGLMSRPYATASPTALQPMTDLSNVTMDRLLADAASEAANMVRHRI